MLLIKLVALKPVAYKGAVEVHDHQVFSPRAAVELQEHQATALELSRRKSTTFQP